MRDHEQLANHAYGIKGNISEIIEVLSDNESLSEQVEELKATIAAQGLLIETLQNKKEGFIVVEKDEVEWLIEQVKRVPMLETSIRRGKDKIERLKSNTNIQGRTIATDVSLQDENEKLREHIQKLEEENKHLNHDVEFWKNEHEPITEDQPMTLSKLHRIRLRNDRLLKTIKAMKSEINYTLNSLKSEEVKRHYLENATRFANEVLEDEDNK